MKILFMPEPENTTYLDCWYHGWYHGDCNLSYTCHSCGMPVDIDEFDINEHICKYCNKYVFSTRRGYDLWPEIYEDLLEVIEK